MFGTQITDEPYPVDGEHENEQSYADSVVVIFEPPTLDALGDMRGRWPIDDGTTNMRSPGLCEIPLCQTSARSHFSNGVGPYWRKLSMNSIIFGMGYPRRDNTDNEVFQRSARIRHDVG